MTFHVFLPELKHMNTSAGTHSTLAAYKTPTIENNQKKTPVIAKHCTLFDRAPSLESDFGTSPDILWWFETPDSSNQEKLGFSKHPS